MAKKTVKKAIKKVAKKVTPPVEVVTEKGFGPVVEVPSHEARITNLEQRIDRIVAAIDKSRSVRNL
jgi:hypothetical protein